MIGEPRLELKVITLNINDGHNKELMEQCQILREYAQYVAKVRKYTKEMELDAAVECAVDECIREGILKDFLRENRAEVIAMSIFEYNKEEEDKKLRKAEYEAGYDSGYGTGYGSGFDAGTENKAKETAILLANEGDSVEKIAKVLQIKEEVVCKWLLER